MKVISLFVIMALTSGLRFNEMRSESEALRNDEKLEGLEEVEGRRRRRRRRRRKTDSSPELTVGTATTAAPLSEFDSVNAQLVVEVTYTSEAGRLLKRLDTTAAVLTAFKAAVVTAVAPAVLAAVNDIDGCADTLAGITTKLTATLTAEELKFSQSDLSASILIAFPEDNSWTKRAGAVSPTASQYDLAFKSASYISAVLTALRAAVGNAAFTNYHVGAVVSVTEKSTSRSSLEAAFSIKLFLQDPVVGGRIDPVNLGFRKDEDNTLAVMFSSQIAASLTKTFNLQKGASYVQIEDIARVHRRAKFVGNFHMYYQHTCNDAGAGANNALCGWSGAQGVTQTNGRSAFLLHLEKSSATLRGLMEANIRKHFDIGENDDDHGINIVSIVANGGVVVAEGDQIAGATNGWAAADITPLVISWQIWSKTSSEATMDAGFDADDASGTANYRNLDGSLAGDILKRLQNAATGPAAKIALRNAALDVFTADNTYVMTTDDCNVGVTSAACIDYTLTFPRDNQGTAIGGVAEMVQNGGAMPLDTIKLNALIECTGTAGSREFVYGTEGDGATGGFLDGCAAGDDGLGVGINVQQEYRVQYIIRFLNSAFKQVEKKVEALQKMSTHSTPIFQAAAKKDLLLDKSLLDQGINIVAVYPEGHSAVHFDDNNQPAR